MAVRFDARLEMAGGGVVRRLEGRVTAAQKWLDNDVLAKSRPYVPYRGGALANSGPISTRIGSGEVVYDTPYAKYQYYGGDGRRMVRRYTTPGTEAKWFEKAKAANKDAWTKGVEKIVKG